MAVDRIGVLCTVGEALAGMPVILRDSTTRSCRLDVKLPVTSDSPGEIAMAVPEKLVVGDAVPAFVPFLSPDREDVCMFERPVFRWSEDVLAAPHSEEDEEDDEDELEEEEDDVDAEDKEDDEDEYEEDEDEDDDDDDVIIEDDDEVEDEDDDEDEEDEDDNDEEEDDSHFVRRIMTSC